MSRIRSKGTRIELRMKQSFEENEIEFEYQPKIFGKPDFLVPPNVVVFCDSAFWHGRNWRKLKSRLKEGYWREHIERNRKRDRAVNLRLRKEGYVVLRFWNDQIEKEIDACVGTVKRARRLTDLDKA